MNTSGSVHSKGDYRRYYRTQSQVLILSGLTWERQLAESFERMAGYEMLRRFTWELVYQNNKESQGEFGAFQTSLISADFFWESDGAPGKGEKSQARG